MFTYCQLSGFGYHPSIYKCVCVDIYCRMEMKKENLQNYVFKTKLKKVYLTFLYTIAVLYRYGFKQRNIKSFCRLQF